MHTEGRGGGGEGALLVLQLAHGRAWAWRGDVIDRWREQGGDGEVAKGGVNREGRWRGHGWGRGSRAGGAGR